jgi:dihydrofolate synthase / folylpolyglutamate synthase
MSSRYHDTLDYLYGLVNFEHRRLDQYVAENISLERPRQLLGAVGDPQDSFEAIHIAGTKGKGSVAAMCAAILSAAGYRVGLYTSPHLFDFRDRIRIVSPEDSDGRIGEDQLVQLVEELKPAIADKPDVTWYEAVTAIAFMHFAHEQVDLAVVEVGLGGRLDATNVLNPLVAVITSLSLDHTALLGNTLAEIAAEKGGIIKAGTPVVTAPQEPEAFACLRDIAASRNAPMRIIGQDWQWSGVPRSRTGPKVGRNNNQQIVLRQAPDNAFIQPPILLTLALSGRHQQSNCVTALAALNEINARYPSLDVDAVLDGLANVHWPGRLQMLATAKDEPALLVDCAHNVDSARKLAYALTHDYDYHSLWLVIGMTADKDMRGILEALLPLTQSAIMTTSGHPRAANPSELAALANQIGFAGSTAQTVADAVRMAWQQADPDDLICVTGSIFVVGDLLNQWDSLQSDLREDSGATANDQSVT